jgi:transcriptional regulator with XRE-family HTH domain
MDIGHRVRELRKEKGLTVRVLSGRTGLAENSISRIERGERMPSAASVEAIARGLGVEPGDLFTAEETVLSSPGKAEAAASEGSEAAAEVVAKARRVRLYAEERFNRAFAAARETADATQAQRYMDQAMEVQKAVTAAAHELTLTYFRAGGEELRGELEVVEKLEDRLREALRSLGGQPVTDEERDQAQRSSETA